MSKINWAQLVEPISPDNPCGANLEYEPEYQEMEQAAHGKPEQEMGDTVQPAEPPDWKTVIDKAVDLLSRTKDLRISVQLACAVLHAEGWSGFSGGLALVAVLLENYWDDLHPQLDPDDGYDPAMRVNALLSLCDPQRVLPTVRSTPLVVSRPFGRFGLRDMEIARGDLTPADDAVEPPKLSDIEAAFQDCDLEDLQATADAVEDAFQSLSRIEALLRERIGVDQVPDLSPLSSQLQKAGNILAENLARRGQGVAPSGMVEGGQDSERFDEGGTAEFGNAAGSTSAPEGAGPGGSTRSLNLTGEIRSREEVIRVLEKVCEFFYRNEPSSPVPLLLERAKGLVSKRFMDILKNLVPDGLAQAELIRGPDEEVGENPEED